MTLAGSPDRVEAQLVPDAGYELDTFRISGLPRQPTPALLKALVLAGAAPSACRRILRRRRPDVVFGAGGYVSGPMVAAAASLRIPSAIAEADAHLGLANRLAAPLAGRVFLAYPLPDRRGAKYRVVGRPIPARAQAVSQAEGREIFELPETGPVLLVAGALAGARSINDLVVESFAEVGPVILHISGDRDYSVRRRVKRADYRRRHHRPDRRGVFAADLVLSRAGSGVWEIAAAGSRGARPASIRNRRSSGEKRREYFVRAGGAIMVRSSTSKMCRTPCGRCSTTRRALRRWVR